MKPYTLEDSPNGVHMCDLRRGLIFIHTDCVVSPLIEQLLTDGNSSVFRIQKQELPLYRVGDFLRLVFLCDPLLRIYKAWKMQLAFAPQLTLQRFVDLALARDSSEEDAFSLEVSSLLRQQGEQFQVQGAYEVDVLLRVETIGQTIPFLQRRFSIAERCAELHMPTLEDVPKEVRLAVQRAYAEDYAILRDMDDSAMRVL